MSFESVAMSCLVTSLAAFLPSRGLRKLRKWRATFSQLPETHLAVRFANGALTFAFA
jgi:hypothetical protein